MSSLNDCVGCLGCLQFTSIAQRYRDISILESKRNDLSKLEDKMRSELQRNDSHRPTVNNNFGIWVEDVARIKIQINNLIRDDSKGHCRLPHSRNVQLLREVNLLIQSASTLLSYGSAVRESQIFVGRESKKTEEIWECLMDLKIGSIGLYGPGGVGKTTIIMNIANQLANAGTFDKIVFVTISKNVSWARVQENIAMQLGMDLAEHGKRKSRLEDLVYEHLLKMERFLFIFDDMWCPYPKTVWNMIPSPTRDNGFKIVFISRFRAVCEQMGVSKGISLAPLSERDAWDLFVRETGDHDHVLLDTEIQAIAKEIVLQCEGLPINVVTISRAMRGETDATSWRQVLHYLPTVKQETEDYKFQSKELVGYWIAQNYIHNSGDIVASINEGKEILRELIDANMLVTRMEGGIEFFKMHDLIRDFSISIMNQEENGTVAQAGLWLKRFLIDNKGLEAKKVSLIGNNIEFLDSNSIRPSVSTLLLKDNPLNTVIPSFFSSMPNLQVLDISHSAIARFPSSLCKLPKLRALFIQYCTYLNHIPSLAKLQELQYLNLSGTLIKKTTTRDRKVG